MPKPQRQRPLTVPEAADRLAVSEATVWRLLRRGVLPKVKIGTATRVPAEAVDAFIADQLPTAVKATRQRTA